MYGGPGIAFDGAGSWIFGNDFALLITFGVSNSSSCHGNNCKKNFSFSGSPAYGIDRSFGSPEKKKFSISF